MKDRQERVRYKSKKVSNRIRLTVFKSNNHIYAQLIDDVSGVTLGSASSLKNAAAQKGNKTDQATLIGKEIAGIAKKAGFESVVFDRNGYLYHGRVKALAEAAREEGIKF